MSFQWSKAAICLGLMLVRSPLSITAQQSEETHTICDLVSDPQHFDGKSVVVESTIVADVHATVLEGTSCGSGIYLSFERKDSPPKWQELGSAVAAKSIGLDKRILRARVRGVYHGNLKAGSRHIRQLEMTEVQEVQFDGTKVEGDPATEAERILWEPFPMKFPNVAPRATVAKEMVKLVRVVNWPITLGTTKLADAQRRFGGLLGQSGDAGDSLGWLCLYKRNGSDGWVLWLTSSEIDGESIGGFVWMRMSPEQKIDSRCKSLDSDQGIETSPVPLRLGMTKLEVEQLVGGPSGEFQNTFMYFHEHEEKIRDTPYTWENSVDIVYRNGVVWAIHGSLTGSS